MSKVICKKFTEYYEKYCRDNKIKSKVHILKNQHLKINADRLQENDWTPVMQALKNYSSDLHTISMYSMYKKRHKQPRITRSKDSENTCEPAYLKEPLYKSIIETIAVSVIKSDTLCTFSLEAFPLAGYIELLCNSITNQKNLQHLSLKNCKLCESDIICLCRTVSLHTGLQTINLTDSGINTEGARQIATLIRSQKLVRFGETWKQALRYRSPQPDIIPGLRRLTLNDNPEIGDDGFRIISYELTDDLWVKAIDFQNCGITDLSRENAMELIEKNHILRVLDLRRNNIADDTIKYIMSALKKEDDNELTYNWGNSTGSETIDSLQQNVTGKTYSIPVSKASSTSRLPLQVPLYRKRLNAFKEEKTNKVITKGNVMSHNIISELERTKNILHKVSGKLYEEKNKRESLEKQQKEFKHQLTCIRTYLQQYDKHSHADESSSAKQIIDKPSKETQISKISSHKNKNCNTCIKRTKAKKKNPKLNENLDSSYPTSSFTHITNKPRTAAQLLLLVPKESQKRLRKYVNLYDNSV